MPRKARLYLSGYPYHILQRGNNGEACFFAEDDYRYYLELWQQCSSRYEVKIHAYCLMTNHVHLLATPEKSDSISTASKVVGSRYAQYINKKYRRTGTLWEGRHRSSLIQSEKYLLICSRFIELNPISAELVEKPEEYEWSSYGNNARCENSWITEHDEYLNLGSTSEQRCTNYRELFKQQLDIKDINLIRKASQYSHPVSDEAYKRRIEVKYGIKFGHASRGRPRKSNAVN